MTTAGILGEFPKLSALVVGDICLDRWCTYDPAAADVSRETGIPRVGVVSVETTAGAIGTVANNLADLGAGKVAVLGAIGLDGHAVELKQALGRRNIDSSLLIESSLLRTFTYTKLLRKDSLQEDLPRIDFINTTNLPASIEDQLLAALHAAVPNFDLVLVVDQAETAQGGVVTAKLREALSDLARAHPGKLFWVDSRLRAEHFRDVLVKPNEGEAEQACQRLYGHTDLEALRRHIGSHPLIVTRGSAGAEVFEQSGSTLVPGRPIANPVDICGAGDSFSAGAALALAVTGSPTEAARIGNLAASITIMKKGTGTATPREVLAAESQQ
ncbi:MAG: ribokinase [Acidobacteriia bacterium]|nr:ribokinase [Terriglobia bacterium]